VHAAPVAKLFLTLGSGWSNLRDSVELDEGDALCPTHGPERLSPASILSKPNPKGSNTMEQLTKYGKAISGFTPEREKILLYAAPQVIPLLDGVTHRFYENLALIPETAKFIEGKAELLKKTHRRWLESLFTGPFDANFTRAMYHVGEVHVKVNLPVEFMAGAMTLIVSELITLIASRYPRESAGEVLAAINAVAGFSLLTMQKSYQSASLAEELEKFLQITGMSRVLFNNLAAAYK
jgi:hypothetical protein